MAESPRCRLRATNETSSARWRRPFTPSTANARWRSCWPNLRPWSASCKALSPPPPRRLCSALANAGGRGRNGRWSSGSRSTPSRRMAVPAPSCASGSAVFRRPPRSTPQNAADENSSFFTEVKAGRRGGRFASRYSSHSIGSQERIRTTTRRRRLACGSRSNTVRWPFSSVVQRSVPPSRLSA